MDGWIILDKPEGITSAHAVAKVKRLLSSLPSPFQGEGRVGVTVVSEENNPHLNPPPKRGRKNDVKIGHAGTLDPLASGILPLALGEATKTIPYMVDADKEYAFTVAWGEERSTDDREGHVIAQSEKRPTQQQIEALLTEFISDIEQTPPIFSAIKVDGERAYDLARAGEAVELKARRVRVFSLSLRERAGVRDYPRGESLIQAYAALPPEGEGAQSTFLCHCGKGTYIRSLGRDMGRKLGCYGHISSLRRLRVGKFDESRAISLELLEKMVHKGDLTFVRPVESALDDILALDIDSNQAIRLKRGQDFPAPRVVSEGTILARHEGKPVAICSVSQGLVKPIRVFNLSG